ncbi:hypothetical protein D3C77_632640 [compost metagenome]
MLGRRGDSGGRRGRQRYADPEDTALTGPGTYFQGVAKYAAQAVSDGQAQAQAFFRTRLVTVQALELFENHLQLVVGNPGATVPDFQPQLAGVATHPQQNRALAIAEGVGKEVLQDAPQQLHVAVHP